MKKETLKFAKFTLEKFEVAKLSNLKIIKGGNGADSSQICTVTDSNDDSSGDCIRPVKPIKP